MDDLRDRVREALERPRTRVRKALEDDDPPALIISPEELARFEIQRCPFHEVIAGPNPRQCQRPIHTNGPHRWVVELLEVEEPTVGETPVG